MDKRQEYRQGRLAIQLGMVRDGKSPAEIRRALAEYDRREQERERKQTKEVAK